MSERPEHVYKLLIYFLCRSIVTINLFGVFIFIVVYVSVTNLNC